MYKIWRDILESDSSFLIPSKAVGNFKKCSCNESERSSNWFTLNLHLTSNPIDDDNQRLCHGEGAPKMTKIWSTILHSFLIPVEDNFKKCSCNEQERSPNLFTEQLRCLFKAARQS